MSASRKLIRSLLCSAGERIAIAWRPDLTAAEELVRDLNEEVRAEYDIEEASGKPTSVLYSPAVSLWLN
jgi:hypothetical protein